MNAAATSRPAARALLVLLLAGASLASGAPVATITAPASVTAGQAGYAASVPSQAGVSYSWSISNGSILVGAGTDSIAFVAGSAGSVGLTCRVTDATGASATGTKSVPISPATPPRFNLEQALTDFAQKTTIGFDAFGMVTGNLEAQSFFPPGKVADYWGFQNLRDNDPDDMGHNTSFLTRAACNVLYVLTDEQLGWLKALASSQVATVNQYAYQRYPLMKAFRRLVDGDVPAGSTGLDVAAVKVASRELYQLDGEVSFDRAVLYARIFRSLSAAQKAVLGGMAGKGWSSWPARTMDDVKERMKGLSQDESVAVMTYAGDLFSWYVGSVDADVYFCPERHGTYFGSFYMKDAPAIGHEGYGIDEQLTATVGSALCDASLGYVAPAQAALVSDLVDAQRGNLYAGATSIVSARVAVSNALRRLVTSEEPAPAFLAEVRATVLSQSGLYGELDGENVAAYATASARLKASLSDSQKTSLLALRRSFMSGTYADGTPFDFTVCATPFLYAAVVSDLGTLAPYLSNTDRFFVSSGAPAASFAVTTTSPVVGESVSFTDTSTGSPTAWSWSFGDGGTSGSQNPGHAWSVAGTYTVTLTASNASGSSTASRTVTVASGGEAACTADATTLCLYGGRFKVRAAWKDYSGATGTARAQALTSDSGYFWFFDAANVELLAKMVNGCAWGSKLAVYVGGLTDVETTIQVTDTRDGTYREYQKPLGQKFTMVSDAPFSCP